VQEVIIEIGSFIWQISRSTTARQAGGSIHHEGDAAPFGQ